jgi:hypothetical protein
MEKINPWVLEGDVLAWLELRWKTYTNCFERRFF